MYDIYDTNSERDYWSNRYEEQRLGWDIGHPSTPLVEYIEQLDRKDLRILIPGAGCLRSRIPPMCMYSTSPLTRSNNSNSEIRSSPRTVDSGQLFRTSRAIRPHSGANLLLLLLPKSRKPNRIRKALCFLIVRFRKTGRLVVQLSQRRGLGKAAFRREQRRIPPWSTILRLRICYNSRAMSCLIFGKRHFPYYNIGHFINQPENPTQFLPGLKPWKSPRLKTRTSTHFTKSCGLKQVSQNK